MVIERNPCVYILASDYNGTIYVGVTSDLLGRIVRHRAEVFGGYTARNAIKRLVYFEMAASMDAAIAREKKLKRWRRSGNGI